jgi:hypothetical protein
MTKDLALWAPKDLDGAMRLADQVANTAFAPKEFRGKPQDCLVAMMYGNEIGLPPMASLQSIAVINGRPSVWGDAALAIVQNHPDFEDIIEEWDEQSKTATCTIKRRGRTPVVRHFSMQNAKDAKLSEKDTYKSYPERMCQMRARSYAMRDMFPEVFKGISVREEVEDYPAEPRDVTPDEPEPTVDPAEAMRVELDAALTEGVSAGAITPDEADQVMENSRKYGQVTTLRKFVDKVKASVRESIDAMQPEETEPEDVTETADLDAAADQVFDEIPEPAREDAPEDEEQEYDPEAEGQADLDIF